MPDSGGEVTVQAPAELDLATSLQLSDEFALARSANPARVVIDMSEVTFCDLTALRVLLDAADRLTAQGCVVELHEPPKSLRRMAKLLGVSARLGLPEE